jgi:hypothetical protein
MGKLKEAWDKSFKFVTLKFGLLLGAVVYGIMWLLATLNLPTFHYGTSWVDFTASSAALPITINVRQQASQGVIPQLGNKFLDLVSHAVPFNMALPDFIGVLVGGILVTFLGVFLHSLVGEKLFAWIKNAPIRKGVSMLLYGMVAAAVILGLVTGLDFFGVLIAMLIYAVVASLVIALLMKFKPLEKVVQ